MQDQLGADDELVSKGIFKGVLEFFAILEVPDEVISCSDGGCC